VKLFQLSILTNNENRCPNPLGAAEDMTKERNKRLCDKHMMAKIPGCLSKLTCKSCFVNGRKFIAYVLSSPTSEFEVQLFCWDACVLAYPFDLVAGSVATACRLTALSLYEIGVIQGRSWGGGRASGPNDNGSNYAVLASSLGSADYPS
jgi:hypothetical protein